MDAGSIKEVLREVFGHRLGMEIINGWVSIRCPLARWTHERGQDGSPSAGVSINNTDVSIFNCFTCKNTGPLHSMLQKYSEFSGEDLSDLIGELEEEAYLGPRTMPSWEDVKTRNAVEVLMPINEAIYMDLYDSAAGHPYLADRGIEDITAQRLELLFDPKDPADGEARILFPVRGYDGALYGFSGRAVNPNAKLKVRDYAGLQKAMLILGAHLVARDNPKDIVLVEGLFDYANAHQCGQYGCALMHAHMTEHQVEILREISKPTYLFLDNDKAGREGMEIGRQQLASYMPTMGVRYPQVQIEDDSEQGWHWLKDPGEMTEDEFLFMKENAKLF